MMKLIILALLFLAATASAQTQSPEGTKVPPALILTVPSGIDVWELGRPDPSNPGMFEILVDKMVIPRARASVLAYCKGDVMVRGRGGVWYRAIDTPLGISWAVMKAYPCDVIAPPPVSQTNTLEWVFGAIKPDRSDEPDTTKVYRDGVVIASVPYPTVTYQEKVTSAGEFCYEVSSANEAGESPKSPRVCKVVK